MFLTLVKKQGKQRGQFELGIGKKEFSFYCSQVHAWDVSVAQGQSASLAHERF